MRGMAGGSARERLCGGIGHEILRALPRVHAVRHLEPLRNFAHHTPPVAHLEERRCHSSQQQVVLSSLRLRAAGLRNVQRSNEPLHDVRVDRASRST